MSSSPSSSSTSSSSSSSSFSSQPPLSKRFSTTTSLYALHHFDTQAFAQRLEASGISREQADVLTESLRDVVDESITNLAKGLVTREEGDQTNYTQKVDFTRLKSELQLLERNDFALMKSENERLMADVEKLKQRLREEITRTTAGVRLDLNLEKGRIRDESAVHALKIKEVDTRIESEIAGLRTSIQSAKFNVLQASRPHSFRFYCQSFTCSDPPVSLMFCDLVNSTWSVWQPVQVLCFWLTSECSDRHEYTLALNPIPLRLHDLAHESDGLLGHTPLKGLGQILLHCASIWALRTHPRAATWSPWRVEQCTL